MDRKLITAFLKTNKIAIGATVVLVVGIFIAYNVFFGIPEKNAAPEQFTTSLDTQVKDVVTNLHMQGFIKNIWAFNLVMGIHNQIKPGAYKISKSMNPWQIAEILKQEPYMKWVVIPEGLRKEQIAEILAKELDWDQDSKVKWITTYTAMKYEEIEGVYFPDTYLIPVSESPLDVANRLRAKFNEKFAPYSKEALKQNIKWDTLMKIASIVQREASGKDDMPLVAGIIWNRLLKNMKLEVDATIQYVRDDVIHYGQARFDKQLVNYTSEGSWWDATKSSDKDIESPYNTYRNKGLPPHPICNPGLEAINAVLHPIETECLYYLHDSSGQIHCSITYDEHQQNIEKYLK